MSEKRPGLKYTVLPANHPILASIKSGAIRLPGNGQLVSGSIPAGPVQPQSVVLQGTTAGLFEHAGTVNTGGQVRIVNGGGVPGISRSIHVSGAQLNGNQVFLQSSARMNNSTNPSSLNQAGQPIFRAPSGINLGGQVVRVPSIQCQKSVIVGNQRHQVVRIIQPPNIKHLNQQSIPLEGSKPQTAAVLQPRIVQVATQQPAGARILFNSQQQKLQQIRLSSQPSYIQTAQQGQKVLVKPESLGTSLQNQIIRTADGQQFIIRRSTVLPSNVSLPSQPQPQQQFIRLSSRSSVLTGPAQLSTQSMRAQSSATSPAPLQGTGSISYSLVSKPLIRSPGGVTNLVPGQTFRFSAPVRTGQTGSQTMSVGTISSGGQVRLVQNPGSNTHTYSIISGTNSTSVGSANIRFTTANNAVNKNMLTGSAAQADVIPGAAQTIPLSQYLALNPRSQYPGAQIRSTQPVPEPKPDLTEPIPVMSSYLLPRNPNPVPVSTSHSPVSPSVLGRKVFLSNLEEGGQKVIRFDVRSLQSSQQSSQHPVSSSPDKVPMARIISTNLNSAPEIRLGDTTLTPAPSLNQVQGKDWTELKSPPRFDSFRLVTQDGRVLGNDSSALHGLQLLSAQGNLIQAEELPVLAEPKKHNLSPTKTDNSLLKSGVSPKYVSAPNPSNLIPVNPADFRLKNVFSSSPSKEMKGFVNNQQLPGPGVPVAKPKPKPRSKPKPRESLKARMQKLESALNMQHLVNILDSYSASQNFVDGLESRFLDIIEEEYSGLEMTKEKLEFCREYYSSQGFKKRYIDISRKEKEQTEVKLENNQEYLTSLLKKHVKLKRLRHALLTGEEKAGKEKGGEVKSKSRGRPAKVNKMSPLDLKNLQRYKLWSHIMKKEVVKGMKARNYNSKEKLANAKRIATSCMRVQRQRATTSQKIMKESIWRAKRIAREVQTFWKKNEREEKIQKRAQEKVEQEQRKQDIELIEAKRQQRKLNYLITQTELYAHFMAGKMGVGTGETEQTILSRLDSDIQEQRVRDLDDYNEREAKEAARVAAAAAAKKQEASRLSYDRSAAGSGGLRMSEAAETAGDRPQPQIFQGTLKSYQLKGMNWLCSLYDQGINGILADEMGLGKTVQSLAFLAYVAETYGIWGPFLVVTPASTLHNWQQELARFLPEFKTIPYWGSPQERKVLRGFWSQSNLHTRDASFHIVITSYQIIVSDFKYFSKHCWQYMVLDEAQAIKSANSQRWKMLLEFKCRGRLLLSGTPIQNTMAELWSLLHFVMPALFDSHDEFKEWFSRDIEGHAEGSRAKVDEKQISRLHLILKPFMLRRIKKDVEHELTDKLEILLYCPLTIRQKLLYAGLKKNIQIEELLAGLGLGSGTLGGVSSLMNLVMQFRKVCNHPELFERREPKSPFIFSVPPISIPRLLLQDKPSFVAESPKFSVFRADRVHREYLEVPDSAFGFLNIVKLSPAELESQVLNLYHQWLLIAQRTVQGLQEAYSNRPSIPEKFLITQINSTFLSHCDHSIVSVPETISHRIIRSRHLVSSRELDDGTVPLVPEFPHLPRSPRIRKCVPTPCPGFLMNLPPKAGALPQYPDCSSRMVENRKQDHIRMWIGPGSEPSAKNMIFQGMDSVSLHYTSSAHQGIVGSSPPHGWSNILIPDKDSLINDAGKLFVLDGLLAKLKEEGHRVLIYSQMTKMIDLLEEFMSYRQHSYIRLDGSSKIHERRDMVSDFQSRQDIFVFLLSTRAGGLGINLTAADTVIFYDSDWNPTVDQQAMDRAHRLGQTKQVTVYRLICKGTIEERILQRAREKSEIHRMVIQGGSFKGKSADLKPKEVVSLLLDDDELDRKVREKVEEEEKMEAKKSTPLKRKHVPDPSPGSKLSPDQPGLAPIKRKRDRTGAGGKRGRPKGSFTNKTSSRIELESTEAISSGINSHESKLNGINPGQIEENVFGFYNQVS